MDQDATLPTLPEAAVCTICLDPVAAPEGARSVASLRCGHKFHLDCIGSAFNAKGIMQCPNCRNIEKGNWLNANRLQPSTDSYSGFGNRVARGPFQLLHSLLRQTDESVLLNYLFRNSELEPISSGGEGDPTADLSNNVGTGTGTEPRNSGMEQCFLDILPMVDLANHTTNPFGFEVPRNDGSNQRRSTPPTPQSGSSSVAPFGSSPAVTSRGHGYHLRSRVVLFSRESLLPPEAVHTLQQPEG